MLKSALSSAATATKGKVKKKAVVATIVDEPKERRDCAGELYVRLVDEPKEHRDCAGELYVRLVDEPKERRDCANVRLVVPPQQNASIRNVHI